MYVGLLFVIAGAIFSRQLRDGLLKESDLNTGSNGAWSNNKSWPKDQPRVNNGMGQVDNVAKKNETHTQPLGGSNTTDPNSREIKLKRAWQKAIARAHQIVRKFKEEQKVLEKEYDEIKARATNTIRIVFTLGMHLLYLN